MPRERQIDLGSIPVHPDEVWQGGLSLFPSWIEGRGEDPPFRPWFAAWCDGGTGQAFPPKLGDGPRREPGLLAESLRGAVRAAGADAYLPGRLQVTDAGDAVALRESLAGTSIVVEVVDRVEEFRNFRDALRLRTYSDEAAAGIAAADGCDIGQIRSFAEAAAAFYRAEPWEQLDGDDLIEIDCDIADPKFRLAVVMGSMYEEFGIFFMESREQHESILSGEEDKGDIIRLGGDWGVSFVTPEEIPIADHDLWLDHGLPLAGPEAYPFPVCLGPRGRVARPNPRQLAFFEGLMRALAASTDDELDSGDWTKAVPTSSGDVTIRLRLPALLADMTEGPGAETGAPADRFALERGMAEVQRYISSQSLESIENIDATLRDRFMGRPIDEVPSTAATPLERAQDLAYRAFSARGRTRFRLVRQALAISPDCADAYGILAARTGDLEKTRRLLTEGVAAGERGIRSMGIADADIEWGDIRCRPYLRNRFAFGLCLIGFGEVEEATKEFEDLMRRDTDDNQGARYKLLPLYMAARRDADALALLDRYSTDAMAVWTYARALLAFRQEGESARTNALADRAIKANPYAWKFLAGMQELPDEFPESYQWGSRDEAIVAADEMLDIWQDTPGAGEWIRARGRGRFKESKKAAGPKGRPKGPAGRTKRKGR